MTNALQWSGRPVRLTLVSHYFPAHRGGVESVAWEIASRLASSGIAEITWYASDTDPPPPPLPGLRCVPSPSYNAAERHFGFPYPIWTLTALVRLVREVRKSDVIHIHDCLYLSNLVAFVAAWLWRRPVVVTQHIGMVPFRNPITRTLIALANLVFGSIVLGTTAQTIFISDTVLGYFRRFVRFRNPPRLVPNGVDTSVFFPATLARRHALRARVGVEHAKPLLLFVGRFVEKKGVPIVRELAERLPHAHWILVGWGPIDPHTWSRPNVFVKRNLTKEQLAPLYQAADLLVLPSVGEGFPLVVQEAMACGTPALVGEETAAGCPQAGELLLREKVGTPDTAARWAIRIESLMSSPELLRSLSARVAEFAHANWSWERCVQEYAGVLAKYAVRQ